MSATTRPDFAQKLLSDLRLRKERMAAAQSSGNSSIMSADAYGSSRRSFKGSTEMKPLAKVNSNTGKLQRVSSGSQSSRMKVEASNQIAPYGGGHSSKQTLDLSMTLSYALDDKGKLKKMNLTGSNAMIGFLQQISRRSMDFVNTDRTGSSRMQWPSTTRFPTLTHLHINEINKGAQKLNRILTTFSNGVNSGRSSIDVGQELLKGALDLEESLRMLVSLQEASECMVIPQRRQSRVKLLEMGEDGNENSAEKDDQKSVERPVFSFDRRSKNLKATVNTKPTAHRRSASCGAELGSVSVTSEAKREGARISNVVAKLMGLEENPKNGSASTGTGNQSVSHKGLDRVVSQRMTFGFSRSDEFKDGDDWNIGSRTTGQKGSQSNKIVVLTSKKIEPQKESEMPTSYGNYKARVDERKPTWSQREREDIMTHVMELNKRSGSREELREDKDVNSIKEQGLRRKDSGNAKKALSNDEMQRMRVVAVRRLEAANPVQGKRASNQSSHEKRSVNKLPVSRVGQDKSVRDVKLQHPKSPQRYEPQGKKNKLEARNNKKVQSKSPARNAEASETEPENSMKDIHEVERSEKVGKEMVLQELPSERQRKMQEPVRDESSVSSKRESLVNLKPDLNFSLHQEEVKSQVTHESVSLNKVAHSNKMVNGGPSQKANEVMAKPAKSGSRPSRAMKQQTTILQGLKKRQWGKKGSQQTSSNKQVSDKPQKQMELQCCEGLDNIPQIHSNHDVNLTLPCGQLDQPMVPGQNPESKPQSVELVRVSDSLHNEKGVLPKLEVQKPLTEDEMCLKQILITSQIFLSTAEALFKLNIPIGLLNANDATCQVEEDSKLTIDCAYEMLKMKGRRRELVFYPCKSALTSSTRLKCLDDLVRLVYKDLESLRGYGRTGKPEFDPAEFLLKMLERDVQHRDMDVNCMWDMGWKETVFAYVEMDEVARDLEKCMINELLDEVLEGFVEIGPLITHQERVGFVC